MYAITSSTGQIYLVLIYLPKMIGLYQMFELEGVSRIVPASINEITLYQRKK